MRCTIKSYKIWLQKRYQYFLLITFTKSQIMLIERTSKEIIFRLPSSINFEDLQDIANLFTFKEIALKSKATQKDVDGLVKKIKKGRWNKTKQKLGL